MKNARQFAIKEIINVKFVSSQDELRQELKKRGLEVTQATLSRDLHELGVGKVVTEDRIRYVLPASSDAQILRPIVGSQVVSITANEYLIVIKTLPGCANAVAEFLDAEPNTGIIGTIAGDNTLLVIPDSVKNTKQLIEFLKRKLIEGV